jgi:succinoglycan biosynthesis transport protein ExoP
MNSETIEQETDVEVQRSWGADARVRACFGALYRRVMSQSTSTQPLRVVGVTSCRRGEGVSTVASRLAIAAAEQGEQKVLLVDVASDRDPDALEQALQHSSLENLWMLPAGSRFSDSPGDEARTTLSELLSGLATEFSFVVLDMPPVDELDDVAAVASAVDGVLLVVAADETRASHARSAAEALSRARVLGAVLNKRQEPS